MPLLKYKIKEDWRYNDYFEDQVFKLIENLGEESILEQLNVNIIRIVRVDNERLELCQH